MKIRRPGFLNITVLSKVLLIMALDVVTTMGSFFLGLWFRCDFSFQEIRAEHLAGFLSAIGPWCAITVVVFVCFRLYSSIWAFVSTSEVFRIIGAYLVLAVLGVTLFHFDGFLMPRASMVVGYLISFVCTVAIRFS